jgi:hypothetical protein
MFRRSLIYLLFAGLLPAVAASQLSFPVRSHGKTVWNYDGGLSLATDGSVPDGPCFRLIGHLAADDFFENLRREDTSSGTLYRRGNDIVTEFPSLLHLSLVLYDRPCSTSLQQTGTRTYLNKGSIEAMRVRFAWKRGMELRPVAQISRAIAEARPIRPYAGEVVKDLPEVYEWWFNFDVPGKSVPLTDSLVIILTTPTGHIIARVAARM